MKRNKISATISANRRRAVIFISAILLVVTLMYVEHPVVRVLKQVATKIGVTDSSRTVVGMTDLRSVDHVRGDVSADTMIIEYSDLSCIMCAAMQENFEKIAREERVALVSRHLYPFLEGFAFDRAVAAECVAKHAGEDAFFEFTRYIYDNQHEIGEDVESLANQAVEVGTDLEHFRECISIDKDVREHIKRDSEEGWELGARGTPYIVVVHKDKPVGISYANDYDRFLARVKMLIGQAQP